MSQSIEVGSVLGGRYRVTEHVVTSADQDRIFTGLDQVLNRRVTILVASRENATQVAASARELAMGERHDEVQVLDLGLSEGRTYLIAGGNPDHDVLLGMAYPADTYIEPFQTDTLGSEIFGSSREAEAEARDDDEAYYSELEERVRADQDQSRRPGFLNRISERLSERVSSESDGTAAKEASAAAALAAASAAEQARRDEEARELERQREEAERAEREAQERAEREARERAEQERRDQEERERREREEAELRRREEQARREREEREAAEREAAQREREEREREAAARREQEQRERREREESTRREEPARAESADAQDAPTAPIATVAAGTAGAAGATALAAGSPDDSSDTADPDGAAPDNAAATGTGSAAAGSRSTAAEPDGHEAGSAPRARRALGTGGSSTAAPRRGSSSGTGSSWLTGALLLVLLIGIAVVGFLLLNQNRPAAGEADSGAASSEGGSTDPSQDDAGSAGGADAESGPAPSITGLTRLVPDMPTLEAENDQTLPQAVDGDPATAWQSYTYTRPNFGGYVSALQLVAELEQPADVDTVTVSSQNSQGGAFSVSLASSPDGSDATEIGTGTFTEGQNSVTVPEDAPEGQYVLITVTELPELTGEGGERPYGMRLSEITVE
ncbi:hypothetical protein HDA30_001762 [Micrococcus cohnii]|uniref:Uncharacterized protein n=1 Tax=Micrococcus cohnii TaxID=993416 RepID=A0A7W7GQ67_9MICC|nr:hypothetical protein [Micrococcus cohnii]MBB4736254.1 hypothetical protein [Micrococcus cohnii]